MGTEIDAAVSRYMSMVQRFPPLDREAERELTLEWQRSQSPRAADKIVRAHLRYVVATALKYRRYGLPVADLIAEGNFGLVYALKKFEPQRGNRFVTYAAYWIRAYILNHIIRSWSMVGGGSGALRSKMFFKLRRERIKVLNQVGDEQIADEVLAERLNLPTKQLQAMLRRLEARDVSLDSKVFDDAMTSMVDTLVSPDASQEDDYFHTESAGLVQHEVHTAIRQLDPRERFIVERRLMADSDDQLSLAEIGRQLGVSRERARQLEARAKTKLRGHLHGLSDAGMLRFEPLDDAA